MPRVDILYRDVLGGMQKLRQKMVNIKYRYMEKPFG